VTSEIIHEYSAGRAPSALLRILTGIFTYPLLMYRHWGLVLNFSRREFHGRFKGSALGALWVLIHPLFTFLIYWVMFGVLLGARGKEGQSPNWYAFYLLSGVLTWTVFVETATRSCNVILENGNLIKKVAFPSELLPLHLVGVNLLVFLTGVTAFFLLGAIMGELYPSWKLLFLPLVLLVQLVFTMGVGLFLACAQVFLRDTAQIFTIVSQAWMFATPIFWHEGMFEGKIEPWLPLLKLNPMLHIVGAQRVVLGIIPGTVEDILSSCGIAFVSAFVVFVLGYAFFKGYQDRFADEV
jgi:ABC-type polysaccharide/polyol phosphate export permease